MLPREGWRGWEGNEMPAGSTAAEAGECPQPSAGPGISGPFTGLHAEEGPF